MAAGVNLSQTGIPKKFNELKNAKEEAPTDVGASFCGYERSILFGVQVIGDAAKFCGSHNFALRSRSYKVVKKSDHSDENER
jgi:hypothetical protein